VTARETRLSLGVFALLAAGLVVNLTLLQAPPSASPAKGRAERGPLTVADKADKARRLALPVAAAELERAAVGAAAAVPSAGDPVETIRAIQRELQARGYDTGGQDGVPGLMTRAAIMAYEHDHGLPLGAEPDEDTLRRILLGASSAAPPAQGDKRPAAEAVIRTVQQTLSGLGYNTGKVDGRLGEDTQRAIREFETDHQLPETGRVSGKLIARLAKAAGGSRLPGAPR
jgi:peptidoglycan hydrolase-like protein with peptidoglycan-binding domain